MAKKGDKILLLILVVSIIGVFGYIHLSRIGKDQIYAVIEVDGKEYQRVELKANDQQKTIEIEQPDGQINIIEVQGDQIRMSHANCPDKICLMMGFVDKPGQTIVCLPNKVLIRIWGEKSELDGITY